MNKLLTTLLAALSTPVVAAIPLDPPKEFNKPWVGTLVVFEYKQKDAAKVCKHKYPRATSSTEGCVWHKSKTECHIVVSVNPIRASSKEKLIVHEIAHCYGWRH